MAMAVEAASATLRVGGITPFTNIDFPGRLAAVLFVQGCPWKCLYCHNPHLQPRNGPPGGEQHSWASVIALLRKRKGLLDGVVFSGGEPTIDPSLPAALAEVRALGFATGLHTAGIYPGRLKAVLPLLDWIGFDVKAPLHEHALLARTVGVAARTRPVLASVQAVLESGIPHEFRTTAHPELLSDADIRGLAEGLAQRGAKAYALQMARPVRGGGKPLLPVGAEYPSAQTLSRLKDLFPMFTLRRG
jgi:pyruvate formate lyase activating enzyme